MTARSVLLHVRFFAGLGVVLAVLAAPLGSSATEPPLSAPAWTRALAAPPAPTYVTAPFVVLPLPDGTLLVRNGDGVVAIDGRGVTRWSMPNVTDAVIDGTNVVFRRSNVVFAVRGRDAAVLWKVPCAAPPYAVAAGGRIVTMCNGASTVLSAGDGHVIRRIPVKLATSPASIRGARSLNDGYVLVSNFFDGAWMGLSNYIVDARSGAFLWSETDFSIVDVTSTTIAISPTPSMLPWGPAGRVVRRRLRDGATVTAYTYELPPGTEKDRGRLAISGAAAYVTAMDRTVFRFRPGAPRDPQRVLSGTVDELDTLGRAAFLFVPSDGTRSGTVYLDRPSGQAAFATRRLGNYNGYISERTVADRDASSKIAGRVGNLMAINDRNTVRLYDEFGSVAMRVESPCPDPYFSATPEAVFLVCAPRSAPVTVSGYRPPRMPASDGAARTSRTVRPARGAGRRRA